MIGAAEAAREVRLGERSPLDLVENALRRIDALDPKLHAWVQVDRARASLTARQRYDGSRHGTAVGRLIGIPVGVKDIIDVDGLPTRAGAAGFFHYTPDAAAAVVERLRQEGAIILGKTATTQFAYADPAPTRNPWRLDHTPGGSSSGSAAAVAAGMVPLALGTQTLGSVLRPAAYCGLVGLKGTHGLVSTAGVVPLAQSLDHVGVFARSVADAALALSVISGTDLDVPPAASSRPPAVGVLRGYWEERATAEVRGHVEAVARLMASAGAKVADVQSPFSVADVLGIANPILRFEAARYHRPMFEKHASDYAPMLSRLIESGISTSDEVYQAAREGRERLREAFTSLFDSLDALMLPVAPSTAPHGLQSTGDASFCAPASVAGVPAVALPSGLGERGLPLAVQLIGRAGEEKALLAAAGWLERVLDFRGVPGLEDIA